MDPRPARTSSRNVRPGLLALLDGGPKHGYQLRGDFERATGSTWPLNVGQVYPTLNRLERDGLVEGHPTQGAAGLLVKLTRLRA